MVNPISVAPPNSLLVLRDDTCPTIPDYGDGPVMVGDCCVLVRTRIWQQGPTSVDIAIAPEAAWPPQGHCMILDTDLSTPSRTLTLRNVYLDEYAKRTVASERTRVRIAVNDERDPSMISVLLGE
jgi:hypothetical protein